jgi:four helix bundle protein
MAETRGSRFEDLVAWQKAMDLAVAVYEETRRSALGKDYQLSGQIHRAAISTPSNIAEGFERGGRSEFHQFLTIAKGSCGELRSHLHLARRVGFLDMDGFGRLVHQAEEVSRIVGGLRKAVQRQRDLSRSRTNGGERKKVKGERRNGKAERTET